MLYFLYNIVIELLAEIIRKLELKGFKISGIQNKILVSLFVSNILVYKQRKQKKITRKYNKHPLQSIHCKIQPRKNKNIIYRFT